MVKNARRAGDGAVFGAVDLAQVVAAIVLGRPLNVFLGLRGSHGVWW